MIVFVKISYALKLGFENQLYLRDENGNLPLHVAAQNPVHKIMFIQRKSRCSTFMNKSVIEILINSYPGASRIRNSQNMLPLQLAILSGKSEKDGIGALLKANPNSVNAFDSNTNLYPFLLSASKKRFASNNYDSNYISTSKLNDSGCLDLTFKLLRSNPNLMIKNVLPLRKRTRNEQDSCLHLDMNQTLIEKKVKVGNML